MQANELRIGNWVLHRGNQKQVDYNHIGAVYEGSTYYSPIPLTPEILEQCGFRYYSEKEMLYDNSGDTLPWQIQYYKNIDDFWQLGLFVHTKRDFYEHVLTHITSLHQLQNFIYFTFNTELQWNRKQ